jgi:hypothetical protein
MVVIGATAALLAAAPAAGAVTIEPPGKAGANQYSETIPSSNGNTLPPQGGGGPPAGGGGAIAGLGHGRTGDERLARLGKNGRAAAALAAATAPAPPRRSVATGTATTGAAGSVAGNATGAPAAHGEAPLSTVLRALGGSGGGGIGVLLPLLLAATLVTAVGLGVWKRRRGTDTPDLRT